MPAFSLPIRPRTLLTYLRSANAFPAADLAPNGSCPNFDVTRFPHAARAPLHHFALAPFVNHLLELPSDARAAGFVAVEDLGPLSVPAVRLVPGITNAILTLIAALAIISTLPSSRPTSRALASGTPDPFSLLLAGLIVAVVVAIPLIGHPIFSESRDGLPTLPHFDEVLRFIHQ